MPSDPDLFASPDAEPLSPEPCPAAPRAEAYHARDAQRGGETVLLVDDEVTLRGLLARMLRLYGYTVLEAGHGREALAVCGAHTGLIHAVVTDVVMPEMEGHELVRTLAALRGAPIRTLYISGYPGIDLVGRGVLEPTERFLQKPLSVAELVRMLRELLDAPA